MLRILAVFLVLLAGCAVAGCAAPGTHSEANRTQARSVAMAPADAWRAAIAAASARGWTVTHSDADALLVSATTPGGGGRWEDTVAVLVTPSGDGATVTVRSGLGHGPNVREVAAFLDALAAP